MILERAFLKDRRETATRATFAAPCNTPAANGDFGSYARHLELGRTQSWMGTIDHRRGPRFVGFYVKGEEEWRFSPSSDSMKEASPRTGATPVCHIFWERNKDRERGWGCYYSGLPAPHTYLIASGCRLIIRFSGRLTKVIPLFKRQKFTSKPFKTNQRKIR